MDWTPPQCPAAWRKVTTIEMHTGGEPLRIPVAGLPEVAGTSVLARRRAFREAYDKIRTALMWEPRGHADMYGAVLTPPNEVKDDDADGAADFGTFFIHNEGYSTMCGHAIIALTKFAVETGYLEACRRGGKAKTVTANDTPTERHILVDAPCGRIRAKGILGADGKVDRTSFLNVPSFVLYRDKVVDLHGVDGFGKITVDVSYGGAFYALVDSTTLRGAGCDENGLILNETNAAAIIKLGRAIKHAVMADASLPIAHPFEEDLGFLYGTIFCGKALVEGNHSRNVCVFADGEVDRSPTGSGVSARAALHHARGELPPGTSVTIESIVGSTFTVQVAEATTYGPHAAVIPEVTGRAWFCGRNEMWLDPEDPLTDGFFVR